MFRRIIQTWREARSERLRIEVEDAMLRLASAGEEINLYTCLTMADSYQVLLERYGSFSNMSEKGKKAIYKMLYQKGRARFDLNMGQGYGFFLLSAYIEAQTLPGKDATFVRNGLETMLQAALETKNNLDSKKKS